MRLWHYTSVLHLPVILDSGYLKTTDPNLFADHRDAPQCVWLLDTPDLGTYSHGLGIEAGGFKTQVRFEVDVPDARVLHWVDWVSAQRIDPQWFAAIVDAGGGPDAAAHWWVTFRRIPVEQWVRIDVDDTGAGNWRPVALPTTPGS